MENDYNAKAYRLITNQLDYLNRDSQDSKINNMEFTFVDPKKAFECEQFVSNVYDYCDKNKITFSHSQGDNGSVNCKASKR